MSAIKAKSFALDIHTVFISFVYILVSLLTLAFCGGMDLNEMSGRSRDVNLDNIEEIPEREEHWSEKTSKITGELRNRSQGIVICSSTGIIAQINVGEFILESVSTISLQYLQYKTRSSLKNRLSSMVDCIVVLPPASVSSLSCVRIFLFHGNSSCASEQFALVSFLTEINTFIMIEIRSL